MAAAILTNGEFRPQFQCDASNELLHGDRRLPAPETARETWKTMILASQVTSVIPVSDGEQ